MKVHSVFTPKDPREYEHVSDWFWHCYLCRHRSRTETAAQSHFITAHPRELLAWYRSSQPLIQAAERLEP